MSSLLGFGDAVDNVSRTLGTRRLESLFEARRDKVWGELSKYVKYQECMRVEFDTEAGTATVLEEGT